MLDILANDGSVSDVIEQSAWEGHFGFVHDKPLIPIEEFSGKIMMFYGGATEMVPSLADRGGWRLVLRRSDPRYLNIHHSAVSVGDITDHINHLVLANPTQGPPAGDASGFARALVDLASNPTIKEIAAGSRLDSVSIGEMVRAVCSLLKAVDAPSASVGGNESATGWGNVGFVRERTMADTMSLDSLTDNSDSAQMAADADRLAEDFLLVPRSIAEDPDVVAAVGALAQRRSVAEPDDTDAWAEQLSGILSRFTD
jgi:hypothetical protein